MSDPLLMRQPSVTGRYWLVLSLLLVLLPHLSRLPIWLAAASVMVIVWRLWRDYRDWPLPGRALRIVLTLLGIGAVIVVFRTILGREAGSALLSVLICLKLLELRTLRDAMLVVFLGYFLVVADFLFDESIFTGLYMFAVVLALSASLIVLNHPAATFARTPFYLKRAGSLLFQAIPLMVVLFVLFPRINSPLWRIPELGNQARTGLSEEMRPGDITNLVESDELVFRVEFSGPIPAADQLYWRGPVLWHTDGRRWFRLSPQQLARISSNALQYESTSEPVRYAIMLEQQPGQWLFALDLPAAQPDVEGGSKVLPDFQLLSNQKLTQRVRYTMSSVTNYRTGDLQPREREYALRLPEQSNPRSRELAQNWRASIADDSALVEHALEYLRTEPFYYTRQPPALGEDSVDQFLFSTRQGFCEHYASAFVTLMRSAGIPARVVTGYQGGDFNAVGNFLEVRQNRAHAWSEVWLHNQGWVRVDPTSVIPPERVVEQQDLVRFQSTAPAAAAAGEAPLLGSALLKLQQGWNAMNYGWNVWVIGFNAERQQALLKKWGIEKLELRTLLLILFCSVAIALAIITFIILYRRPHIADPVLRHYQKFCQRLANAGVECPAHEGPHQLGARAIAALPNSAGAIREIIAIYIALRYGRADASQLATLKRHVERFRPKRLTARRS
jgi:transglutaminase-like putative cysteine protease